MFECVAIIPAGGSGTRFGGVLPKQFTPLGGQMLLWHTVLVLQREPRIEALYVVTTPTYRPLLTALTALERVQVLECAGRSRAETVVNALSCMEGWVPEAGRVLVHDAVRPCLGVEALTRLLDLVWDDPVGGLLAQPLVDTLKRSDQFGRVDATLDRGNLWMAQTPQMFRCGLLRKALCQALAAGWNATDEASAVELLGLSPRLVRGDPSNLKVTYPEDMTLAQCILAARKGGVA